MVIGNERESMISNVGVVVAVVVVVVVPTSSDHWGILMNHHCQGGCNGPSTCSRAGAKVDG